MKKWLSILMFISVGCNWTKHESLQEEKITIIEELDSLQSYSVFENENPSFYLSRESDCLENYLKAKTDYEKGILVYERGDYGYIHRRFRYHKEFESLLNEKGIEFNNLGMQCIPFRNCYKEFMDSTIQTIYGTNFIVELEKKADSLYASKYKTEIYYYAYLDKQAIFATGKEYDCQDFFEKNFRFPNGFPHFKTFKEVPFADIGMRVDSNGVISAIQVDNIIYLPDSLSHFKNYLKDETERVFKLMPPFQAGLIQEKRVASDHNERIWYRNNK